MELAPSPRSNPVLDRSLPDANAQELHPGADRALPPRKPCDLPFDVSAAVPNLTLAHPSRVDVIFGRDINPNPTRTAGAPARVKLGPRTHPDPSPYLPTAHAGVTARRERNATPYERRSSCIE